MAKRLTLPLFVAMIAAVTSCAHGSRPTNAALLKESPEATAARAGRWGAADVTLASESLAYAAGQSAWVKDWTAAKGQRPSLRVVALKNLSDEAIDVEIFTAALSQALINTGKFEVATQGTQAVDVLCQSTLSRRAESVEGALASLYEVCLQLVPPAATEPVWQRSQLMRKWQAPPAPVHQGEAGTHASTGVRAAP